MRATVPRILIFAAALVLGGCQSAPPPRSDGDSRDVDKIAELNTQLGVIYMRDGDNTQAMTKFQRAIAADPNYGPGHSGLALLYARLGETDDARRSFRRALRLMPEDSNTLNNFGLFLCRQGEPEQGQEMFKRAIADPLYRTPEVALSNAGTCALGAGDKARAEEFFRDALQLNPRLGPTLLQMAELSYESGRILPARGYLQRFSQAARHSPRSLWLGVQIERDLQDRDAVSSYAMALKNKFPDSQETRLLLQSERQ